METPEPGSEALALLGDRPATHWRRWPCPRCGHRGHAISIVCPECEALPWWRQSGAAEEESGRIAAQMLRPGVELEARRGGFLPRRHRFSTPMGFLGVLTYRVFGGADWMGADGHEWRMGRVSLLNRTYVMLEGSKPLAAAQAKGLFWLGRYQLWHDNREYLLVRTGITGRNFLLAVEDGPEVLRIRGGLVNPLRRFEVLSEVSLATVILASYLARRMRHGEGE